MTTDTPTVHRIDHDSTLEVRTPWITCPWCGQEHPTEFILTGARWLGFCRASGRPLEAVYEQGDYRLARGAAPPPPGAELPEATIRRMRDGEVSE